MNAALDPAVSRFAVLQGDEEEEAELWRGKVLAFRNLYSFLSQVIPYQDSDLERLYVFLRHLAAKLPRRRSGPAYEFAWELAHEAQVSGYMGGEGNNWAAFTQRQVLRMLERFVERKTLGAVAEVEILLWIRSLPWEDWEPDLDLTSSNDGGRGRIELHFNW